MKKKPIKAVVTSSYRLPLALKKRLKKFCKKHGYTETQVAISGIEVLMNLKDYGEACPGSSCLDFPPGL